MSSFLFRQTEKRAAAAALAVDFCFAVFHTVFLPELTKNEFPARTLGGKQYYHVLGGTFAENKDKYQSTLDDERKLFYVAVTRAKQNL